ncbi:MAG: T9SS type A sorting domain-containing protein [Bacteroidetes bacterium]|nr:T9SS type A sorting domain-containing protein [Bacteroidota bacterium]
MRSLVLPLKAVLVISILFLFSISSQNIFAQLANFDTVRTLISSADYDYKNPVFESKRNTGPSSTSSWLVYERYKSNGASDIIVRKASFTGYAEEVVITNSTTEQNINPAIYNDFLIWQTNKNGNWDLNYSIYNGTSWLSPQIYTPNTVSNEEQPAVLNLSDFVLVAFNRNSDIFLNKYIKATQQWDSEINVTDTISESCYYPVLESGGSPFSVVFHKMINAVNSKVRIRNFNTTAATGYTWQSGYEINLLTRPHKIRTSFSVDSYPYYLINYNNSIVPVMSGGTVGSNITTYIQGFNSFGKGVFMPFITDALTLTYFSAFGCITKRNDSTFISLCRRYAVTQNNQVRQIYISDTTGVQKFDISTPLFTGPTYKMRALWEQKINGKTALVESWAVDVINDISSAQENINYVLEQNYPNPFNPTTKINYEIKSSGFISLKVFDLLGKEVAALVNEKQNAGSYVVNFNSSEFNLPSGIYFYTLNAGEFKETKKMVMVK